MFVLLRDKNRIAKRIFLLILANKKLFSKTENFLIYPRSGLLL